MGNLYIAIACQALYQMAMKLAYEGKLRESDLACRFMWAVGKL